MRAEQRETTRPAPPRAARALLGAIVDYAGLFPPAGLEMRAVATQYARYRGAADAWALGRLVVPAARLDELLAELAPVSAAPAWSAWRISALVGPDVRADLARIHAFERRAGRRCLVDAVEVKAATRAEIGAALGELPAALTAYVEIPLEPDPAPLVAAIREAGGRAKVRTGGVTADAFPARDALLRFLHACVCEDLPFKATAGLHHPVAGRYPLTYEPDSPSARMHGYLNLLFAAALLRRDAPLDEVVAVLDETDAGAFRLGDDFVAWRGHLLSRGEIAALRDRGMVAFGSCSFREPLDELVDAGLLPAIER